MTTQLSKSFVYVTVFIVYMCVHVYCVAVTQCCSHSDHVGTHLLPHNSENERVHLFPLVLSVHRG